MTNPTARAYDAIVCAPYQLVPGDRMLTMYGHGAAPEYTRIISIERMDYTVLPHVSKYVVHFDDGSNRIIPGTHACHLDPRVRA